MKSKLYKQNFIEVKKIIIKEFYRKQKFKPIRQNKEKKKSSKKIKSKSNTKFLLVSSKTSRIHS